MEINFLAVAVAAISGMVVGTCWYGPLFGKTWTTLMGFTKADMEQAMQKGMGKTYATAFASQLVMAFVVAGFIDMLNITQAMEAGKFACVAWLGFMATMQINSVLWEGRAKKLFAINTSHSFVVLLIMSLILTAWK